MFYTIPFVGNNKGNCTSEIEQNDNVYLFVKPFSNMNFGIHVLKSFNLLMRPAYFIHITPILKFQAFEARGQCLILVRVRPLFYTWYDAVTTGLSACENLHVCLRCKRSNINLVDMLIYHSCFRVGPKLRPSQWDKTRFYSVPYQRVKYTSAD